MASDISVASYRGEFASFGYLIDQPPVRRTRPFAGHCETEVDALCHPATTCTIAVDDHTPVVRNRAELFQIWSRISVISGAITA
jgi:hypothetical protein